MPMANTMLVMPAPNTVAKVSPIKIVGKAQIASMHMDSTASTLPPIKPAVTPMTVPSTSATATEAMLTVKVIRAP